MPSDATRSTAPSSVFTPPGQRSRYSQPNLPTLSVCYNEVQRASSASPDRRIRMSQPTLNSSLSGINFVGTISRGRLSYPSLRASGENYMNLRIDEERLSAPNVNSAGLQDRELELHRGSHDATHVLRRDPPHKRERLSQPTLVPGDYYPGRGHQRLSQPCLSSGRDLQTILNSPIKHKRFFPPPKVTSQRDRLYQMDFGTPRSRLLRESQPSIDLSKFNRDRFSIPELETSNDLKLMAGTPKQRFSLDSSLNEPRRRSRLLPIASSPISENLTAKMDQHQIAEGKNAADGLESVLITSTTPLLPRVEGVFDPQLPIISSLPAPTANNSNQRMSVPDISTSSLRRLLDPPAKQRHSLTENPRHCLIPSIKKSTKRVRNGLQRMICTVDSNKLKTETYRDSVEANDQISKDHEPPPPPSNNNVQRHYSYTYETTTEDSAYSGKVKEKTIMSIVPRKKFLESNFDRNEQVITTVIESEVPMILTSPKSMRKPTIYGCETPKWMRKYLREPETDNESTPEMPRRQSRTSKIKAWQTSNQDSVDSVDSEKDVSEKLTAECVNFQPTFEDTVAKPEADKGRNDARKVRIDASAFKSGWMETEICRLYGLDCSEGTDTEEESTSI